MSAAGHPPARPALVELALAEREALPREVCRHVERPEHLPPLGAHVVARVRPRQVRRDLLQDAPDAVAGDGLLAGIAMKGHDHLGHRETPSLAMRCFYCGQVRIVRTGLAERGRHSKI